MQVKDLATLAGTTVRTIRYYHQLGLLAVPEPGTSWRSYGFVHLSRLMRIRWLVESGVPLAEVPQLLRPPGSADERSMVIEDLDAVLDSIDQKIALLNAQRERVRILCDRVTAHGRLSPIPSPIQRLYTQLLDRPLAPAVIEAVRRERDLVELACYRGGLPDDLVAIVDAIGEADLDELCGLWEECHQINEATGTHLTVQLSQRIDDVVSRTVDLATRVDPEATNRLIAQAGILDRPAVRAAIDLAYPSPVYRQFLHTLIDLQADRSQP